MESGALRSLAVNRLIFIMYILFILVVAVSTPTQKLTVQTASPYPDLPMQDPIMVVPEAVNPTPAMSVPGRASDVGPDPAADSPMPDQVVEGPERIIQAAVNATPQAAAITPARPAAVRPVPTLPPDAVPAGTPFQFKDSSRRQIVSVAVRDFAVQSEYSYYYDDIYSPDLVTIHAREGYKFLLVGVIWELVSVVGEGSRTTFRTPGTSSYRLFYEGQSFDPLNPGTVDSMHFFIRDHGTLVMERTIDRDNPGSGVLIFEVPGKLTARDAYLQFCPTGGTLFTGTARTPGEGGCPTRPVRWMLVR